MRSSGSVLRRTDALAYGRTVSVLTDRRASLQLRVGPGSQVAVVGLAGPRQGVLDVWLGARRIGRISFAANRWTRKTFLLTLPSRSAATLRLTASGAAPVRVDAAALIR